jgi:hypothetical protein
MLSTLSAEGVEYLVVGGYALAAHGWPRATKDIDVWVRPTPENAGRVMRALARFGAPLEGLEESDFAKKGVVLQIGVPPRRIDLTTKIDGLEFEEAWSSRIVAQIGALRVPVIGASELIRNKRASGRPQDLADVARLERGRGSG